MIALRRAYPALRTGDIADVTVDGDRLRFVRRAGDEVIHCLFNIGGTDQHYQAPAGAVIAAINGADTTQLPAWGALLVLETSRSA